MKVVNIVKPVYFNLTTQRVSISNSLVIPRGDIKEIIPANDAIDDMLDSLPVEYIGPSEVFKNIIVNAKRHTIDELLLIDNVLTILSHYYGNLETNFKFYNIENNCLVEIDSAGLLDIMNRLENVGYELSRGRARRNRHTGRRAMVMTQDTTYFRDLASYQEHDVCYLGKYVGEFIQHVPLVSYLDKEEGAARLLGDLYRYDKDLNIRTGVVSAPASPRSNKYAHTAIANIVELQKALDSLSKTSSSEYIGITLNGEDGTINLHVTA